MLLEIEIVTNLHMFVSANKGRIKPEYKRIFISTRTITCVNDVDDWDERLTSLSPHCRLETLTPVYCVREEAEHLARRANEL